MGFRRFTDRARKARDLAEEIESHLSHAQDDNAARGLPPEEARRQAYLRFGNPRTTREQLWRYHSFPWIEDIWRDLRYAMRGFRRNVLFTITVIATLALAVGATTAVFSVVDRILFRSLPYAHADRLVSVGMRQSLEPQEFVLGAFFYPWRDNQKPFAALTTENAVSHECDLTDGKSAQLSCMSVQANFLPTLGISPVLGRNFLPEEDRPNGPGVVLISYGLWISHYNRDPGILNKLIDIDGNSVRVVGVLPKDFEMPDLQPADVISPLDIDETAQHSENSGLGAPMRAFARLKPGVSVDQARAELQPLLPYAENLIPPELRKDFHLEVRSFVTARCRERASPRGFCLEPCW